jgi:hypothetical protein
VARIGGEQTVDRAERDRIRSRARRAADEIRESAGVAEPVIVAPPQRIELDRETPQLGVGDLAECDAARRRDRQRDLSIGEAQAMIARLAHRRQDGLAARDRHGRTGLERQFSGQIFLDRQAG